MGIQSSMRGSGQHQNAALSKIVVISCNMIARSSVVSSGWAAKGDRKLPFGHTSAATTIYSFLLHTQHQKAFSHVQATALTLTRKDKFLHHEQCALSKAAPTELELAKVKLMNVHQGG